MVFLLIPNHTQPSSSINLVRNDRRQVSEQERQNSIEISKQFNVLIKNIYTLYIRFATFLPYALPNKPIICAAILHVPAAYHLTCIPSSLPSSWLANPVQPDDLPTLTVTAISGIQQINVNSSVMQEFINSSGSRRYSRHNILYGMHYNAPLY